MPEISIEPPDLLDAQPPGPAMSGEGRDKLKSVAKFRQVGVNLKERRALPKPAVREWVVPFWLLSVLFHAVLIVGVVLFSMLFVVEPRLDPNAFWATDLVMGNEGQVVLEIPQEVLRNEILPQDVVPDGVIEQTSVEQFLDHLEAPKIETTPVALEDGDSGGGGNGKALSGVAREMSAGALDNLGDTNGGEVDWGKVKVLIAGSGSSGAANGTGEGSAAAGTGNGGQGREGVAGSGKGLGTQGSSGTGSAGTGTGSRPTGITRAVQAERVDGGSYPERARKEKREGVVYLKVEVLSSGQVGAIELSRSSGSEDLDSTALSAARYWRFSPAMLNGEQVCAWVEVPVRYALSGQRRR